eukprot:9472515-Pyramimonas_sp.AAC.1
MEQREGAGEVVNGDGWPRAADGPQASPPARTPSSTSLAYHTYLAGGAPVGHDPCEWCAGGVLASPGALGALWRCPRHRDRARVGAAA